MLAQPTLIIPSFVKNLKVWVLAPHIESNDANIDYYYDFSQSIAEYKKTFEILNINWVWQPVTMNNFSEIIEQIAKEKEHNIVYPLIFNICDGDEINGAPGISVIRLLKERGLFYTGADEYFYNITTSKILMKAAFDTAGVPTAKWAAIYDSKQNNMELLPDLGTPIIVKPAVSGGSMGVGIKNIVYTEAECNEQLNKMFGGYRGWNLAASGVIAETFINGNEYTTLIVGDYDDEKNAIIYTPVERVFHPSLPDDEKILSFDRLWEIYEDETAMPNNENFYEYNLPDATLIEEIKKISWDAYVSTKGKGYTRVDLRRDAATGKIFVLEVNAQCGISEDENYTSIGAILRLSNQTFPSLVVHIINNAFQRK